MRKLELKKEQLGSLSPDELANVIGAGALSGAGTACIDIVRTAKDTECGDQCLNTTPINQCLLTILC
jgi:hypothetical protein